MINDMLANILLAANGEHIVIACPTEFKAATRFQEYVNLLETINSDLFSVKTLTIRFNLNRSGSIKFVCFSYHDSAPKFKTDSFVFDEYTILQRGNND